MHVMPPKAPLPPQDQYRVQAPGEVLAYLRQLQAQQVPMQLSDPQGHHLRATLSVLDPLKALIALEFEPDLQSAQGLVNSDEVQAQAWLDAVQLQFQLADLLIVSDARGKVMRAALPPLLYRFQRREAYRVQPVGRQFPVAQLNAPSPPASSDTALRLRVLDISIGGVGLQWPLDQTPPEPGSEWPEVMLELEPDNRFEVRLRLHHVGAPMPGGSGVHLGFSFVGLSVESSRRLQVYIDQTQKRRRQLGL